MGIIRVPCPRCGFPVLLARTGVYEYQYAAEIVRLEDVEFAACHRCQARMFLPGQMARNSARIARANLDALASKWAVTRPPGWMDDATSDPGA